jgi:putative transposase
VTAKYAFIASEEGNHAVVSMCRWSKVSRSGYYAWRDRPPSATARRHTALAAQIRSCFEYSDGTYGYRRVHAQLGRWGTVVDPDTVRVIMRELGLVACQPRPWRPVTTVAGDAADLPDLVGRDFTADAPSRKLVGDITYIRTWEGWLYLATVLDCFSKKVVGYAMAEHMRSELVAEALRMAARTVPFRPDETIFHSDRGCQYVSAEFAAVARGLGVRRSVGRTGVCYEVSQRREFHPPLLSEPGVTVSRHRAPTVEPVGIAPCFQ